MNNKIHFVHAKQSLIATSVTHAKQFSEHTDSFEYRSKEAVIHSLKHEFLIDNWHLINRVPNKISPALRIAPYWRLHMLKNMQFLVTLLIILFSLSKHFRIKTPVRYISSYSRGNISHNGANKYLCVCRMEDPTFIISDPYAKLCTNP